MIVIGLNGRKRSGKDTALEYIAEAAQGLKVQRVAFADKMKLSGVRALGFDPATLEDAIALADNIKEDGRIFVQIGGSGTSARQARAQRASIDGREFWQRYGTEAHRDVYDSEFHVNALLPKPHQDQIKNQQKLSNQFRGTEVLVVTDARFPNEGMRIKQLGGYIWHIDADGRLGPLPADSHISERPLPSHLIDTVIPNNTTLENYRAAVRAAFRGVWKGE